MMLCSGIVLNSTTYFTLSVTEYLHCSTAAFSVYFTIVTACTAIVAPVVGSVVRKIGIRTSILLASAGGTVGFLILSRLENIWMVYTGALCVGIAQTFVVVPTVGVINAWFTKNASTVTGISMSATGFGGLLMGVVMPFSVAHFDWRTGYLICAALWLTSSLLACTLAGRTPPAAENAAVQSSRTTSTKNSRYQYLLHKPTFWILMLTALCSSGVTMITQHMSVHLTTQGMGLSTVSFVMGGMSLALSMFKIAEGALCSRVPEKLFIPAVFLAGALGYWALNGNSFPVLLTAMVCYGCGAASCTVLYPVIMRRLYGREAASAAWGICWSAFMIGQAIWTPLYAWIYDVTGAYTLGLYAAAAAIVLSALFVSFQLSQKRKAEQRIRFICSKARMHC